MRKIAHLSDLHFGAIDPLVLASLASAIRAAGPNIIVVSGDLTQRARTVEFRAARDFLATLPLPQIVVPGNHDVPLYNIGLRAFSPLGRFQRFFGTDMTPVFTDDEIAIVGVNTARAPTFKDGRINRAQVAGIGQRLLHLGPAVTRIVVTHHPFEGTLGEPHQGRVGRAAMAMAGFSASRIDLVLSGHLHAGKTGLSAQRYDLGGYGALMIQAGTASSHRRRGQANSFNIIHVLSSRLQVQRWNWDTGKAEFILACEERFEKIANRWTPTALGDDAATC